MKWRWDDPSPPAPAHPHATTTKPGRGSPVPAPAWAQPRLLLRPMSVCLSALSRGGRTASCRKPLLTGPAFRAAPPAACFPRARKDLSKTPGGAVLSFKHFRTHLHWPRGSSRIRPCSPLHPVFRSHQGFSKTGRMVTCLCMCWSGVLESENASLSFKTQINMSCAAFPDQQSPWPGAAGRHSTSRGHPCIDRPLHTSSV